MSFFFFFCGVLFFVAALLYCFVFLFVWLFLPASYFYQKMCDFAIKAQATVGDLWIQEQWENAPVLLNKVSLPEFKLNISHTGHRRGKLPLAVGTQERVCREEWTLLPSVTPGLLASTTSISSVHRLHFTPLCHLCKLLPLPLPSFLWSKYIYFWIKYQLVSIWWLPLEFRDDNNLHW